MIVASAGCVDSGEYKFSTETLEPIDDISLPGRDEIIILWADSLNHHIDNNSLPNFLLEPCKDIDQTMHGYKLSSLQEAFSLVENKLVLEKILSSKIVEYEQVCEHSDFRLSVKQMAKEQLEKLK